MKRRAGRRRVWAAMALALVLLAPLTAAAQPTVTPPTIADPIPASAALSGPGGPAAPTTGATASSAAPLIDIRLGDGQGGELVPALKIIAILLVMTFIPALVLAMTSFTRIIVVLSLLRQAVGVVQLPPTRVLVGLALFLTMFTMAPVFERIDEVALQPYNTGQVDEIGALEAAMGPMREFMLAQTRESDLMLFVDMAGDSRPDTAEDVATLSLVPAFMLSELKTAFQMGALLFLPFLVIDIAVASILMSMGMMMLPPATISLPLKIIVFVVVDGWGLVAESVATSFLG